MEKIIYHGSEHIIEKPVFGVGAVANDYGRGFYCTENLELAKEWACGKNNDGYANCYRINTKNLSVLNLNSEEFHILNWLAILTKNRSYWQKNSIAEEAKKYIQKHFLIDTSGYDIIVGYRADDSYFSFAQDFVMGTISLQKLSDAMRLGNLGEQIVLKSEKVFERLKYVGNETAFADEYFVKKIARDHAARKDYRNTKQNVDLLNETFILDVMREEMTDDDIRLRSGIFAAGSKSNG